MELPELGLWADGGCLVIQQPLCGGYECRTPQRKMRKAQKGGRQPADSGIPEMWKIQEGAGAHSER